jgi:hypothetical protein
VADDLEHRAAVTESTELSIAGRRKRLNGFVSDLIGALNRGSVDTPEQALPPAGADPALELRERELVRRYLIEETNQRHLDASPSGTVIVAEWVGQTDRHRLREQNRRLSTLLDGVQESAALFGPDGPRARALHRQADRARPRRYDHRRVDRSERHHLQPAPAPPVPAR